MTETTVLDRAAAVIEQAISKGQPISYTADAKEVARAVLQAIREPNEEVAAAGSMALSDMGCDFFLDSRETIACWQAMVDAAIGGEI